MLGADHGDTAAAAADDQMTVLAEGADGACFDDVAGLGRGHIAPPAAACVLFDNITRLFRVDLGLFLGHELTDGLGGIFKGGISGIHLHLGHDGANGDVVDPAVEELLAEGVLQVIANVGLAHSAAHGQGRKALLGVFFLKGGHGVVDNAHLGAVAVSHHHLMTCLNEVHHGAGGDLHGLCLFGKGIAQRVTAKGDDDLAHIRLPHSKRRISDSGRGGLPLLLRSYVRSTYAAREPRP